MISYRGESPIGNWTIHVSDQNEVQKNNGSFLGWSMMFWGSAIDPEKTRKYEVTDVTDVFPPIEVPMRPVLASGTIKQHPKPTSLLPGDHGTKEGENSQPAFASPILSPSATAIDSTPDEGWFSDLSKLASNQKWFFGAVALVVLFGLGAGVFFYLRRRRQRRAGYGRLGLEEMSMNGLGGRGGVTGSTGRTRELYDAFGEVSEDEDDADENTGLTGSQLPNKSMEGIGFHSGFLDDEDPAIAGGVATSQEQYRDENLIEEEDREEGEGDEEKQGHFSSEAKEETRLISGTGEHSSARGKSE